MNVAYVAAVSFPVPGREVEQLSKQSGKRAKEHAWAEQKMGRSGEVMSGIRGEKEMPAVKPEHFTEVFFK